MQSPPTLSSLPLNSPYNNYLRGVSDLFLFSSLAFK